MPGVFLPDSDSGHPSLLSRGPFRWEGAPGLPRPILRGRVSPLGCQLRQQDLLQGRGPTALLTWLHWSWFRRPGAACWRRVEGRLVPGRGCPRPALVSPQADPPVGALQGPREA